MKGDLKREFVKFSELEHHSPNTRKGYWGYCEEFIIYSGIIHPKELKESHIIDFISYKVSECGVSISTHHQIRSAIKFMYDKVLKIQLDFKKVPKPKRIKSERVYYSREEIKQIFAESSGVVNLIFRMLYGCGFRLTECLELRLNQIDFDNQLIIIRQGKGRKDRIVRMPESIIDELRLQYDKAVLVWNQDQLNGIDHCTGRTEFHYAWLFPANNTTKKDNTKRYCIHPSTIRKALKQIEKKTGISKSLHPHALRHSFASHDYAINKDPLALQNKLGHKSFRTTLIYTHPSDEYLNNKNPLDNLKEAI